MLYFKHSELTDTYHVSLKTVHNWIDAAKVGKLELALHEQKGRTYVANTPGNIIVLEKLAEKGKKYRNVRFHKVVKPSEEFYQIFSRRQILGIISNLSIHREILHAYDFLDGGADNWKNWVARLEGDSSSNMFNGTIKLMQANMSAIERLCAGYKKVNVIDIGVGNGRPVKELLARMLQQDVLHRYIAIDISQSMLDIAKHNIREWFGDKVKFEGHVRDITFERFDDLLVDDMLGEDADQTVNLVLLLGATPKNFRSFSDGQQVIYGSMGENDLLLYTQRTDTKDARRYFDFHRKPGTRAIADLFRFVPDLMNIDESLYETEMGFDEGKRMRYVRIRLKTALTIQFRHAGIVRDVLLERGDAILLLRIWHLSTQEVISTFEETGFTTLRSDITKDRQYLLTISGIDTKSDFVRPS